MTEPYPRDNESCAAEWDEADYRAQADADTAALLESLQQRAETRRLP